MKKAKIHPLTNLALIISSILMASYAYRNFKAEEIVYGIVFVLLCVFLLALVIFGLVSNRTVRETSSKN